MTTTKPKRRRRLYMRQWRKSNPERMKDYAQRQNAGRKKARRELVSCLKTEACADCGNHYPPWIMEFDHVPERGAMSFRINPNFNVSLDRFIEEIEKCDVVCSNCHANRTYVRRLKPR